MSVRGVLKNNEMNNFCSLRYELQLFWLFDQKYIKLGNSANGDVALAYIFFAIPTLLFDFDMDNEIDLS